MSSKLFILVIFALILRLLVLFLGYHGDLNNNISWATLAVERGLNGFYGESGDSTSWPYSAPNQPPLTILLFAALRNIWQFVENTIWWMNNNFPVFPSAFIWFWEQKGMTLLVKLPSIIADIGIALLIFNFFEKKKKGLILACLWLFNPVVWYNSSVWGQTDSIVNFLGFAGILCLLKKDIRRFAGFFTLSLLFKGSLAIFVPVFLAILFWKKHTLREWLGALGVSLLVIVLISVWFHPQRDLLLWLISLYQERILPGEIGYLTANAFNFWWLIDSGKTLDSTIYLGLPARVWGFVITLIGMVGVIYWSRKNLSDKNIFFILAFISLVSFLFMTRIHERYLFPFFIPATILLGFVSRLLIPYTLLSAFHLLNLYHLFWIPSFSLLENLYTAIPLGDYLSIGSIFLFGIFVFQYQKSFGKVS